MNILEIETVPYRATFTVNMPGKPAFLAHDCLLSDIEARGVKPLLFFHTNLFEIFIIEFVKCNDNEWCNQLFPIDSMLYTNEVYRTIAIKETLATG